MKKKTSPEELNEISVKLKPFLGIKPGIYLLGLYSAAILLILFFLLFFPGIKNNGNLVYIETLPTGSSVYINETRAGASPGEFFIPAGNNTLTIKNPGFVTKTIDYSSKGRIFASLLFPARDSINIEMICENPVQLMKSTLHEVSSWSPIMDFSDKYQYPPLLSRTTEALISTETPVSDYNWQMFLNEGLRNASSTVIMGDYLKALLSYNTGLKLLNPQSLLSSLTQSAELFDSYSNIIFLLNNMLSPEVSSRIMPTEMFTNAAQNYVNAIKIYPTITTSSLSFPSLDSIQLEELTFFQIPSGKFIMGEQLNRGFFVSPEKFPHPAMTNDYYISGTEITNKQFSSFVQVNPDWAPSNKEILMEQNLVTDQYLRYWEDDMPLTGEENQPVTYVSQHAAKAYTEWFSSLPSVKNSGLTARLPQEDQWERASFFTADTYLADRDTAIKNVDTRNGITGMRGSVWEWSLSAYHLYDPFFSSDRPEIPFTSMNNYQAAEYVVKGGSWANSRENLPIYTRGAQPPEFCTPFLGFRMVLTKETR